MTGGLARCCVKLQGLAGPLSGSLTEAVRPYKYCHCCSHFLIFLIFGDNQIAQSVSHNLILLDIWKSTLITMSASFSLYHIPTLFVATATTFGGLIPFFNAEDAIREFGLPERIAISKPAQVRLGRRYGTPHSNRTGNLHILLSGKVQSGGHSNGDSRVRVLG